MKAAWLAFFAAVAWAQTGSDQTGSLSGTVMDAVTHLPVKKAIVSVVPIGGMGGRGGPGAATTDASGGFTIENLQPGKYLLMFQQRDYPQDGAVSKRVEVKAGEASESVSVELTPGAAVTGHVTDEDGDPLRGCVVRLHPPDDPEQGVATLGGTPSDEDGVYRVFGVAAGKYLASAQCAQDVFQPRLFSAGPDPPPSRAYPVEYYPLTTEEKSAQAIQLTAGMEKSGVDFQMTPSPVTQIHGSFSPAGADWRGSSPVFVRLVTSSGNVANVGGSPVNREKGTFEFRKVFAGSYTLEAFSNGSEEERVGAWQKIDVSDRPLRIMVELKHAMDLSGKAAFEGTGNSGNQYGASPIQLALRPIRGGMYPSQTQVGQDGVFTLKGVLPGLWRLMVFGPAFIKSAWLGSTDVTDSTLDLTGGAPAALRVVLSSNTATIRGSAPAGETVLAQSIGDQPQFRVTRATQVDENGQYTMAGVPPGKYQVTVRDQFNSTPGEGGQEITVHEGETANLNLKAPAAAQ